MLLFGGDGEGFVAENGGTLTDDVYSELMMTPRHQQETMVSKPMRTSTNPKEAMVSQIIWLFDWIRPNLIFYRLRQSLLC